MSFHPGTCLKILKCTTNKKRDNKIRCEILRLLFGEKFILFVELIISLNRKSHFSRLLVTFRSFYMYVQIMQLISRNI